jgi:hypothetical protein
MLVETPAARQAHWQIGSTSAILSLSPMETRFDMASRTDLARLCDRSFTLERAAAF